MTFKAIAGDLILNACVLYLETSRCIARRLKEGKYVPLETESDGLYLTAKGISYMAFNGSRWVKDIWRGETTIDCVEPILMTPKFKTVLGGIGMVTGIYMMTSFPREVIKGAWTMSQWAVSYLPMSSD